MGLGTANPPIVVEVWHDSHVVGVGVASGMWFVVFPFTTAVPRVLSPEDRWQEAQPEVPLPFAVWFMLQLGDANPPLANPAVVAG